jgi:nucleobindin
LKEAEKEAKFQGITVEEALKQHEEPAEGQATHPPPETDPQFVQQPGGDNVVPQEPPVPIRPPNPKVTRLTPPEKQDPAVKFKDASKAGASKGEWGAGDAGYKSPSSPSDKMRKNLPYKVKSSVLEFALY